ncbi:radical S-adenosyl methionine domain-containing protein 1, mitochondrial [Plectropomus leopardus]|uniref:radical S-adenosyl methionine domain-containing protein 1, mitochondrial n=1 Tax=Plectropomus leopardus TaxID=160734 RepID=UPI001C4D6520|nr:radical S-adenosyl methionine domain-containing protein 1, mitochondrial [Plectropomus leopardus]XP_042361699.1 radical S-adenosyl methionine domain-containing protein 1, mitochondrial [Plectropomus leopardus]
MIRHALHAGRRALCPGLRCFSGTSGGEIIADLFERTDPAHLTKQASLYVHWPYCLRRCSYCNFNKYIPKENNDHMMTECLQRETETLLQLSQVSCITSVFFGGGTPSLAPPSTIAAVLETVSRQAYLPDKAEVTLEVNPTPVGKSRLEDYCCAGVNRFSIGVQSLQDEDLKILGRDHSPHQTLQTIEEARRLCPGRVSVDVMFGRPKQSVESWENELSELLRVSDDHVSLYQLTLERGTQLFKQVQRGEVTVPAEDVTAEMYQCARRTLHQQGFVQYEVSNFARHNAVSHHNMSYWRGSQYIGVGPGAHGRFVPVGEGGVVREARTQTLEPDVWIREVQQRGHGTRRRIQLSHLELLEEVLVMGLRMTEGIYHKHWGIFSPQLGLHDVFGKSSDVQELLQSGQLILDDRGLRCSWDGLALLDSMLPALLVELERQISQRSQRDHHCADGPTKRTSNPR